jgi:phosphatidylglycerophosphate synthase
MTLPGDKISNEYQNPIDIMLLQICRLIDKPLHDIGITPNMITLFGLFTGILSIHYLISKNYLLCFVLLWITYLSDCLDGFMARKYNDVTKLGDYLDHFRDQFVVLSLIVILTLHIENFKYRALFVFIIILSAVLMLSQLGCQEKITEYKVHNECLNMLTNLCPGNPKENIKITKWFGCGTFFLILSIFIVAIKYKDVL